MRAWIAGKLAIGLYVWRFIRRHKTIRALILWLFGLLVVAYVIYGDIAIEVAFLLIQLGLQLGFAVVFMVVQFVALFWFISRTRTTVIRPGDPKTVTLDMYWGQPNLVKLMTEWLHLLNEPDEFKKMGGKYISGVLLHGPPGTGKTMLAKALAGQGGVGFIGCEGSGFRGMFFGPQPLTAMILTVDGWKQMGAIVVGDYVYNRQFKPTKVLETYDKGTQAIYEIALKNGRHTWATAQHPWVVKPYGYNRDVILGTCDLEVGATGDKIPFMLADENYSVEYSEIDHIAIDGYVPVKCISIDDPHGLYITDDYILTHNTDTMKVMQFFGNAKKMARQYGACCVPGTLVLTSDLRWIPVESLNVGDKIIGIDEDTVGGHKKRRTRIGEVEYVGKRIDSLITVVTDNGEITVSREHPFLAHSEKGLRGNLYWTEAQNLVYGQLIKFLSKPWESESGDSWLAGIIDGEGSIAFGQGAGRALGINISQKSGPVLNRIIKEIEGRGMPYHLYRNSSADQVVVSTMQHAMRILGQVRPMRLLDKFVSLYNNAPPSLSQGAWTSVKEIREVGDGEVVTLQTSIRTYIANGFISHNCIGYIDELDAIGASRGGVQGGGQVMGLMGGMGGMGASGALTRLLYEMDGLGEVSDWENCQNATRKWFGLPEIPRGTVLIMGSTNRRDVLDPALMRPGRFDQIVQVDPPDKKGREAVIRGYLNAVKHDDTIDIDVLVSSTSWATPAKIASAITKTAVRYAIFDKRDAVSQKDIEKALIEQAVGIAQPVADMDEKQLEQIAYHESGHAIAEYHLCPHRKIAYLTITRRSEALGFMLPVSKTDIYSMPLEDITADIMVSLGGHVATEIALGRPWTGASSDFEHVRARVRYLASLGYLGYLPMDDSKHSEEVEAFVKKCLDATGVLLLKHRKELEALARTLLERRDMSGEEVVEVIKKASEE